MNNKALRKIQELTQPPSGRSATRWADHALVTGAMLLFLLPFVSVAMISLWSTPGPTGQTGRDLQRQSSTPEAVVNDRSPEGYASTFTMKISNAEQLISLWVKDLDTEPFFRQTVEIEGRTVTDQIFRYDRRRLYTARAATDGELTWTFYEDVQPEDIDLLGIARGPGVWASEYGVGTRDLPANGGTMTVTITSVGEPIPDAAFELPAGTAPIPAQ